MIHGFLGALRETTRIDVTEKPKKMAEHQALTKQTMIYPCYRTKKLFWSSWVAFLGDINRHDMSVPTCQRRLVVDVNAMKPLLRGAAKC